MRTQDTQQRNGHRHTRVLFFDHTAALGGGEIALLNLVTHLDRNKIDPVVVLGADGPLSERLRLIVETHVLPLSSRVMKTSKDSLGAFSLFRVREISELIAYTWRLKRFIGRHDIDLVHANSLKADIIGGVAGRFSSRPVIWHVRDRIQDDYLPWFVARIFRYLSRLIPDYVIANSAATLVTLHTELQRKGTPQSRSKFQERSTVVHDGTDMPAIPELTINTSEPFRIGLIGRICPWKGQHIFLRAAAMVHERFPTAQFLIVGAPLFGEDGYAKEIRELSSTLAIEDVVTFTGFRADVKSVIATLDLVVHASILGEPFGQVIIEGMAAGKPVVATDGGGVPEIVKNLDTGLLIPMGDCRAMAEAICQVLGNRVWGAKMGARGRQRVRDHFTIEQTARGVEAVYEKIVGAA